MKTKVKPSRPRPNVRIVDPLWSRIKAAAAADDRSANSYAVRILERAVPQINGRVAK